MSYRSKEEKKLLTGILLYLGSHWPTDFVPENDLHEAANEFWRLPRPDLFFRLVQEGKAIVQINDKETKDRCGSWLMWSISEAGKYEAALDQQRKRGK
jgi:hypothetical protein